jgi:hypothetical protein
MRLLQDYPGTKDLTYPFLKKPGYWWLYEAASAPIRNTSSIPPR